MKVFLSFAFVCLLCIQSLFPQDVSKKSSIIETYKGAQYYMHFVNKGETIQTLALLYGISNVEILRANPEISSGIQPNQIVRIPVKSTHPDVAEADQEVNEPTVPDSNFHIVQPHETWFGISRTYKVPVKELIMANPDIDTLKIGMSVRIPKVSGVLKVITSGHAEHTVLPQETLYSLSKKYSTTIEELIRLNPVLNEGLKVGQVLSVPATLAEAPTALSIQVTDTNFINHTVERKETLYGISRLYNVEMNDIIKANPGLDGNLRKGYILKIPKILKDVRPLPIPDSVIMGRAINRQANTMVATKSCSKIANHNIEYNIALLIPMQLELMDSISLESFSESKSPHEYISFDFIQFYEGALIAADSMASLGMKVKVHVFDCDFGDDVNKTRRLLNNRELDDMNMIIGPFFAESFNLVLPFAQQHNIPLINPLSRRSEFTKGNGNVIKLQPSTWSQTNALAQYLKSAHSKDNIIILRRNGEDNKGTAQVLKNSLTLDSANSVKYKEVIYSISGWSGLSKKLVSGKQNIIVIVTTEQAILSSLLRELSEKAESYQITVVGLSEWEELELDYNYLMKLNTHFFKPWFVDYNNPGVKHFLKLFRDRYIAEPEIDKYAFLGYDATFYFLNALYYYGGDFLKCLESINCSGLSNDFRFYKVPDGGYENQSTSVYKYSDYQRVKVN